MEFVSYERVVELAHKHVENMGQDYVYKPDFGINDVGRNCVYYENGQPSCIVGHILADLGLDGSIEHEPHNTFGALGILNYYFGGSSGADEKARYFLYRAQILQDLKMPWGEAVERAIKESRR